MTTIAACPIPGDALLGRYLDNGGYADCYSTLIAIDVSHAAFVEAFYTTPLFKVERLILRFAVAKPSTDAQAAQLAAGTADTFAAWRVEARAIDQLLLSDMFGRTRSWLMVRPEPTGASMHTRLYFGSAVVPVRDPQSGQMRMGLGFGALAGFHRLYSRLLLASARTRLARESQ